jgi:CHASE2 domain-containing sensor protein
MAVAVSVVLVRLVGILQPWELAAYDQLMRMRPSEGQDQRLLIVEVTDADIQSQIQRNEEGQGTLKDASLQGLLIKLQQAQPQVIGLDIFRDFPAKQPELAKLLQLSDRLIGLCELKNAIHKGDRQGGVKPPVEIPPERLPERVGFSNLAATLVDSTTIRTQLFVTFPDAKFCPVGNAFSLVIARRYLEAQGKLY